MVERGMVYNLWQGRFFGCLRILVCGGLAFYVMGVVVVNE